MAASVANAAIPEKRRRPITNHFSPIRRAKCLPVSSLSRSSGQGSHFSHFETLSWLQDGDFRFAFGQAGKLFRVTD